MSPPHFGVCSFAISASNPTVLGLAAKLGKGLGYTGHAALEFKKRVGPHFAWNDPLPGFADAGTFLSKLAEARRQRWKARLTTHT